MTGMAMKHDPDHSMDGYRELWLSVLLRALRDALLEEDKNPAHRPNFWWPMAAADKNSIPLIRDRGREWLLENKVDFDIVCEFAGLDPKKTRDHIRGMLDDAAKIKEARAALAATADEGPGASMRALLSAGRIRLSRPGKTRTGAHQALSGSLREGAGGATTVGVHDRVDGEG